MSRRIRYELAIRRLLAEPIEFRLTDRGWEPAKRQVKSD